jgi:hypothetical protein
MPGVVKVRKEALANKRTKYLVSADEIEKQTGYNLLDEVADDVENVIEAKLAAKPQEANLFRDDLSTKGDRPEEQLKYYRFLDTRMPGKWLAASASLMVLVTSSATLAQGKGKETFPANPGPASTYLLKVNLSDLSVEPVSDKKKGNDGEESSLALFECTVSDELRNKVNGWCTAGKDLVLSYGTTSSPISLQGFGSVTSPASCVPGTSGVGILDPNSGLHVRVIRPREYHSSVSSPNPVQVTALGIERSAGPPMPEVRKAQAQASRKPPGECQVDEWYLGPRAPGPFTVATSLVNSKGEEQKVTTHVTELVVETQYMGAIRVGVGMIVPFGQNSSVSSKAGVATYSVRPSPNGGSAIYRDTWSPFDLDLIAGYTAFLHPGPRRTTQLGKPGWGLFSGLGILSVSSTTGNIIGLPSAYLGLEFSWRGFAAILLAGAKRVTLLPDGYEVGSPIAPGSSVPTSTAYRFATGLLLSYTSDVFKFAGSSVP